MSYNPRYEEDEEKKDDETFVKGLVLFALVTGPAIVALILLLIYM